MALTIGPNRHLTVRGRRFVPADGLARYSAAVSDRGSLTSHDAALFWRSFDVSRAVGLIFSHRPRESEREAPGLGFVGSGVRWLFFVNYRVVNFFAYWRAPTMARRFHDF